MSIALVRASSGAGELTEVRRIAQFFRIMRIVRWPGLRTTSPSPQDLQAGAALHRPAGARLHLQEQLQGARPPSPLHLDRGWSKYDGHSSLFYSNFSQVLIFSSLTFVFEKESTENGDGKFHTMLDAYWWALITMTTVRISP